MSTKEGGALLTALHPPHPPPQIRLISGWEQQGHYRGQGGVVKYKPGWVSTAPGAVVEFEVNSKFAGMKAGQQVRPGPGSGSGCRSGYWTGSGVGQE